MKCRRSAAPPLAHRPSTVCCAALILLAALPTAAQEDTRRFVFSPAVTLSGAYTETDTGQARSGARDGEFVTQVSPGFRLAGRGARVQGSLDYTLNATWYSKTPEAKTFDNALSAAFTAEAVENRLFIEGRGHIAKQSLSPYGTQSVDQLGRYNDNRAEVGTATLSPYLVGQLGSAAAWQLRYNVFASETRGSSLSDSLAYGPMLSVFSRSSGALVGWAVSASQQTVDFKAGRKTDFERFNGQLFFRPHSDWQLSLNAGQERTDVGVGTQQRYDNWGAGLRWTPTPRTTIAVQGDERYFGRGHSLVFEHRMRRSVWRYSDIRDSSSGGDPNGVGQPITLYELLFLQFASVWPDPVQRDRMVRDFLRSIGRDPNELVAGGVLTAGVSLQRRRDLSWALLGRRTTLTLQAFASDTQLLDTASPAATNDGPVHLWGYVGTVSHRLTPTSTVSLSGSRQVARATLTQGGNNLKSVQLTWDSVVSVRTSVSLGARYSVFNSPVDPYREAALTASLGMRF